MLYVVGDVGFLLVIFFIFGLGAAASVGEWILEHLILVGVVFAVKSLLIYKKTIFQKQELFGSRIISLVIVLLDIARDVATLICLALVLDDVLSNGLLDLALGILLTIPIMGSFLLAVSEGPMYIVYGYIADSDEGLTEREKRTAIICEIVCLMLLVIYYFVVQAMK